MPFNERFWREDGIQDKLFSWDGPARCSEAAPVGIKGFIVALPIKWTAGESNWSGMNLTLLANREETRDSNYAAAVEGTESLDGAATVNSVS